MGFGKALKKAFKKVNDFGHKIDPIGHNIVDKAVAQDSRNVRSIAKLFGGNQQGSGLASKLYREADRNVKDPQGAQFKAALTAGAVFGGMAAAGAFSGAGGAAAAGSGGTAAGSTAGGLGGGITGTGGASGMAAYGGSTLGSTLGTAGTSSLGAGLGGAGAGGLGAGYGVGASYAGLGTMGGGSGFSSLPAWQQAALKGAGKGALSSAAQGENPIKGAFIGGISGGLGGYVGGEYGKFAGNLAQKGSSTLLSGALSDGVPTQGYNRGAQGLASSSPYGGYSPTGITAVQGLAGGVNADNTLNAAGDSYLKTQMGQPTQAQLREQQMNAFDDYIQSIAKKQ